MILLLDIGNTRVKWACYQDGVLIQTGNFAHSLDSLGATLKSEWGQIIPQRILMSNVASDKIAAAITVWANESWKITAGIVKSQKQGFGVVNSYEEPQQLGADRWAALIAAKHLNVGAACVIDCGSAITIDAIAANGMHLGGLIAPGLEMMRNSLVAKTHNIKPMPKINNLTSFALGHDTRSGIMMGTLYSAAAFIDRAVNDVSTIMNLSMTNIITGGDAKEVLPMLKGSYQFQPHLVLLGLSVIASKKL